MAGTDRPPSPPEASLASSADPDDLAPVRVALVASGGVLGDAARALGWGSERLRSMVRRTPELEAVRAEAIERVLDAAEQNVMRAIREGDVTTSRWMLGLLGGERGYTRHVRVTGPAEGGTPEWLVEVPDQVTDETGRDVH